MKWLADPEREAKQAAVVDIGFVGAEGH